MSVKTQERPPKPTAVPFDPHGVPDELTAVRQWLPWGNFWDDAIGKWDKRLIDPRTGRFANWSRPECWLSFDAACRAAESMGLPGVEFIFTADDPFVGIDIDNCRDPATGGIHRVAAGFLHFFNTYTEVSPSGKGVKAFGRGRLPRNKIKRALPFDGGRIELYSQGQPFTVTGQRLPDAPATVNDVPTVEFCAKVLGIRESESAADARPASERVQALIDARAKLFRASDAAVLRFFREVFTPSGRDGEYEAHYVQGDPSKFNGDDSDTEFALCRVLWKCGAADPEQIDRLYRGSALMRGKWDARPEYARRTIEAAILKAADDMVSGRAVTDIDLKEYYERFGDH